MKRSNGSRYAGMDLARTGVGVFERVEKGDEAVAAGVLSGDGAGVAAVDDMLEEGNFICGGLGIARGGFDDLECDVGGCLGVVGEPDGAKVTPSATQLALINATYDLTHPSLRTMR